MKRTAWQRIHIGADRTVPSDSILGIFDMDSATVSPVTRKFLGMAEKRGAVRLVCEELPKSFVVTAQRDGRDFTVYLAQLSPATIAGRGGQHKESATANSE